MKTSRLVYIGLIALTGLWCAGILAAPMLAYMGNQTGSHEFYSFFGRICHQQDWRSFHLHGEKFGVCIRCSAIYFSFFVGVVLYPVVRRIRKLRESPRVFLLIISAPMILDVCMNVLGLVQSTTTSRLVTGSIFGFFIPWFMIPSLEEAVQQIRKKNMKMSGDVEYVGKTE